MNFRERTVFGILSSYFQKYTDEFFSHRRDAKFAEKMCFPPAVTRWATRLRGEEAAREKALCLFEAKGLFRSLPLAGRLPFIRSPLTIG